MKTKQIVFTKPNVAELLDVTYSAPRANEVTVALEYSAISAGTEKANIMGIRNSPVISENKEPVFPRAVGYSAAGVVTHIGSKVKDIAAGDRVIVYWGKHQKILLFLEKML